MIFLDKIHGVTVQIKEKKTQYLFFKIQSLAIGPSNNI